MLEQVTAIDLPHRERIEGWRRSSRHALSAHAFTSLFLWQAQMKLRLCLCDGGYSVRCDRGDAPSWFFPCGEDGMMRAFLAALMPGKRLIYLREQDVSYLHAHFPGAFAIARRPDDDEYLYSIAEHLALSGGAYANMRTQVHKIERDFAVRNAPLDARSRNDALTIIRRWTAARQRFEHCDLRDDEVDETAVSMLEALGMEGVVTYLDGAPMAVTAGFALTPDTFDIAVSKCADNLQGLSYYAKRALMAQLAPRYARINLEEDLGIPGLRRMKQSLHPVGMNPIWEAIRL